MKQAISIALLALAACETAGEVRSAPPQRNDNRILVVQVTPSTRYVIDPVSRLCFLERSSGLAPLPCESLVADPTAARLLTWIAPPAQQGR